MCVSLNFSYIEFLLKGTTLIILCRITAENVRRPIGRRCGSANGRSPEVRYEVRTRFTSPLSSSARGERTGVCLRTALRRSLDDVARLFTR